MMKKTFGIIFSAVFIFLVYLRLYFVTTDGFSENNIKSSFVYHPAWKTKEISLLEKEKISKILSQPFFYLGKGCQSYVFESQDQEYVVKFFKYQRFRLSPLAKVMPVFFQREKMKKKQAKRERFFQSWKLGFNELQEETGLLYVQLNQTDFWKKKFLCFDKVKKTHILDLNQMQFLVQKKAKPFAIQLKEIQKDPLKIENLMDRLFSLLQKNYEKGIVDLDPALFQNIAFLGEDPILVDVGQFSLKRDSKNKEVYKQDLYDRTKELHDWLILQNQLDLAKKLEEKFFLMTKTEWQEMKKTCLTCY